MNGGLTLEHRRFTLANVPVTEESAPNILTRIIRNAASSPELLKGNLGAVGEKKDIPILVPHDVG